MWRPESVAVLVRRKAAVGQPGAATATALKPVWTGLPVSLEKNGTYVKVAKDPKFKVDAKRRRQVKALVGSACWRLLLGHPRVLAS